MLSVFVHKCLVLYCPFAQAQRGEVHFWKVSEPELYSPKAFPVICRRLRTCEKRVNGAPTVFYAIPVQEYPGLIKVYTALR